MHAMEAYGRCEVQIQSFLISALDGISGHLHAPVTLPSGEHSLVHIDLGVLVGHRANLNAFREESNFLSLPVIEVQPLGCPAP
jgi:hypothetical protein